MGIVGWKRLGSEERLGGVERGEATGSTRRAELGVGRTADGGLRAVAGRDIVGRDGVRGASVCGGRDVRWGGEGEGSGVGEEGGGDPLS